MAFGLDKSLGPKGAGMMDDSGKLTQACRDKFVQDVLAIMTVGNPDGMGLLATGFLPLPVFPVPGPKVILNPILSPQGENLFWFNAEPLAPLLKPLLSKPDGEFQKIFIDGLFEPLVKMLNIDGKTPLFPIFDPTCVVDLGKFPNLTLPQIPEILIKLTVQFGLAAVPVTLPAAKIAMALDFGISDLHILDIIGLLVPPKPPLPPLPPVPSIPIPTLPDAKLPGVPSMPNFPDLALGMFKMPLALFPQLIGLVTSPTISPPDLLLKIIGLIVDILLGLLQGLGLLVGIPKLLLAFLMVLVKDLAVMLLCDVVSQVLGTAGIVKIIAGIGGVV